MLRQLTDNTYCQVSVLALSLTTDILSFVIEILLISVAHLNLPFLSFISAQ